MLVLDVLREVARLRQASAEELEAAFGSLVDAESGLLEALDACMDHNLMDYRGTRQRERYVLTKRGRRALRAAQGSAAA